MAITVELTYDMAKAAGERRFEVDAVATVAQAVEAAGRHLSGKGVEFAALSRTAAIAVNGVLVNHKKGMKTPLADGDTLTFVKAAAGG